MQFVDDGDVSEMLEDHREVQIDEYETDSDDEDTENEEHQELVKRACITRSDRAVRAFVRLDLWQYVVKTFVFMTLAKVLLLREDTGTEKLG